MKSYEEIKGPAKFTIRVVTTTTYRPLRLQQALYGPKFKMISTVDAQVVDSVHYLDCISPDQKIVRCDVLASLPSQEVGISEGLTLLEELNSLFDVLLEVLHSSRLDVEYDFSGLDFCAEVDRVRKANFPNKKGVLRICRAE